MRAFTHSPPQQSISPPRQERATAWAKADLCRQIEEMFRGSEWGKLGRDRRRANKRCGRRKRLSKLLGDRGQPAESPRRHLFKLVARASLERS